VICPLQFLGWNSFCTKIMVKWVVMTFSLVDMYSVLEEHAACVWYPSTASTVCGRKMKSALGMKEDNY